MQERKVLGSYNIGKTIGQGAFSKVKLGVHKETGQKVAIKIIDKKQMAAKAAKAKKANEEREKRKKAEAAAAAANQAGGNGKTSAPVQQRPATAATTDKPAELPPLPPKANQQPSSSAPQTDAMQPPSAAAAAAAAAPEAPAKGEATATSGPTFISQLQLEVQLLMRLDHPNVINLYQVIDNEDECFVVMEYASGGELIEYIASRNYLSEKEARRFFRQIISAIDHCHQANVVHRDLKLENLLLNDRKDILISDFGLGRTFTNDVDEYMKTFCGTPNYAAVELISGIPYIGVKSDIWAMGVVLYVMMTGKPPFTGENISALYSKIKTVDYTCPDYFSQDLRNLLSKILKKDPRERIDMDSLRNDPWVTHSDDPINTYPHGTPPQRYSPKVTGPPQPEQVGQCIASITRGDDGSIIYTIRNHSRDAAAGGGAGVKGQRTRALSSGVVRVSGGAPAVAAGHGGAAAIPARRRSSSLVPNAMDLRRARGQVSGPAPVKEDEEEVSELPAASGSTSSVRTRANSGSTSGVQTGRRMSSIASLSAFISGGGSGGGAGGSNSPAIGSRLTVSDGVRPQTASEPGAPQPKGRVAAVARGDDGDGRPISAGSPGGRKRRSTMTQIFETMVSGGTSPTSKPSPGADESFSSPTSTISMSPTMTMTGILITPVSTLPRSTSTESNSRLQGISSDRPTAVTTAKPANAGGRSRRASMASPNQATGSAAPVILNHDTRGLTVMRRMSMVMAPEPSSPHPGTEHLSAHRSGTTGLDATTTAASPTTTPTMTVNTAIGADLSKREIEEWHLMHRPAREVRTVRYNFNSRTTSPLNPAAIFQEVHRVLLLLQQTNPTLTFARVEDLYLLMCKVEGSMTGSAVLMSPSTASHLSSGGGGTGSGTGSDENAGATCEFEIEVCKIWLLKLNGVRIKRLTGSAFLFKDIYSSITSCLAL